MPQKVVIIGGGIVGVSSAYFLSHHSSNPSVTLVEASSIAAGASGKAGGLLALDWHGDDTASLAALSYRLHVELAENHNGQERWGYRQLNTLEISCSEEKKRAGRPNGIPNWVREGVVRKFSTLGTPETTAQVHPRLFCESIVTESRDLKLVIGYATKFVLKEDGSVRGVEVEVDGGIEIIEADAVVVAAGPWTPKLLPNIAVSTQRAHSITISTPEPVSPHALFTTIRMEKGSIATAEIYPRADEVYACGDVDNLIPLPKLAKDVQVDKERCKEILKNVNVVTEVLEKGEITAMQACYLPYSEVGPGPSIGWVPGMRNIAVATGHSCWGICNGPGTGKIISELVCDGDITSADIKTLDPAKYVK
ncbi:hypothetical protein ABW19_dt0202895 [Dactylella cylindrospora]|nr:hypothetical protein ABW19_dt0202895 [Dactylella cylindrospora]